MDKKMSSGNFLMVSLVTVFVGLSGFLMVKNHSLKVNSTKEKSVLVTENGLLKSNVNELLAEKGKLNDLNLDKNNQISKLQKHIGLNESEIRRLSADNAKVNLLRKRLAEYEEKEGILNGQILKLRNDLGDANSENDALRSNISNLRGVNENLYAEIVFLKSITGEDFRLDAIKRNQKITAFAKRTKVITVNFDFPEKYINELNVKVVTPEGKAFTSGDLKYISITNSGEPVESSNGDINLKRLTVNFKPEKRFSKGIYKFTIYKGNTVAGTMQLRLK